MTTMGKADRHGKMFRTGGWLKKRRQRLGLRLFCIKPSIYLSTPMDISLIMMTSSNGKIFRVTGHLCGEFTGHRWIPRTKASNEELWFPLICAWPNSWVNNGEAGDLRRHRTHYDVTVMYQQWGWGWDGVTTNMENTSGAALTTLD